MKKSLAILTIFLGAAGVALHAFICFVIPEEALDGFVVGLFVFASLPYLACLLIALRWPALFVAALLIAGISMAIDVLVVHDVFWAPTSSTASLALLVAPLLKLVIAVPVGLVVGWIARRKVGRGHAAEAR